MNSIQKTTQKTSEKTSGLVGGNGRRALTPLMALRLSRLFGNSAQFWMNAQLAVDLWTVEKEHLRELSEVPLLKAA